MDACPQQRSLDGYAADSCGAHQVPWEGLGAADCVGGSVEVVIAGGATFVLVGVADVVGAALGGVAGPSLGLSELGGLVVICDGSTAGICCTRVVVGGRAAGASCPGLAFGWELPSPK
jgi:hypothetical protein